MVNLKAGTNITHVPFKSSGQALIALLGGHVSMQYGGLASAPPYMKDGKVRAIAITGDKRDPAVPDVPTFKESRLEGVDVSSVWPVPRIVPNSTGASIGFVPVLVTRTKAFPFARRPLTRFLRFTTASPTSRLGRSVGMFTENTSLASRSSGIDNPSVSNTSPGCGWKM